MAPSAVGPGPGWYPDISSAAPQERYWDGQGWTGATRTLAGPPPAPVKRPGRWRAVKWGAVGTFVLVASALVWTLVINRQQLCSLDASGKFIFAAQGQACISQTEQRALAETAEAAKSALPAADPDAAAARLDGIWLSRMSGSEYRITQAGQEATIEEFTPGLGLTAFGSGTIGGQTASFAFTAANGTMGRARYVLVGPDSLQGTIENDSTGISTTDALVRVQ